MCHASTPWRSAAAFASFLSAGVLTLAPLPLSAGGGLASTGVGTLASSCSVTLFADGFEGGMSGWATSQVAGQDGRWTAGSFSSPQPHGGNKEACFNSRDAQAGNRARLFRTSGVAVASSLENLTLTFWMFHDTGQSHRDDTLQVQVSTDGTNWNYEGPLLHRFDGSSGWKQESVDLTAYKGQSSLQIGFLGTSAWGNYEFIDDVALVGQNPASAQFHLSGRVTLGGAGLSGVTVSTGATSAVTDASGAYSIGVTDGSYTVTPSRSGYWFSPSSRSVTTSCADQGGLDFQAAEGVSFNVTTTADELDTAHGGTDLDTGLSLREAVVEANRNPGQTAWINLQAQTYGLTRAGRNEDAAVTGDLDIAGKVVVVGAGKDQTTIDGNQVDRVLDILGGASVELRDLTIRNGLTERGKSGGAIYSAGTLKLVRTVLSDNATGDYAGSGSGNSAGHGGAIYCTGGSLTVTDSVITSNRTGAAADGPDGGNSGCSTAPSDGHTGGNGGSGGGIAADSCTVSIDRTEVSYNRTGDGGAGGRGGSSRAASWCDTFEGARGGDGGNGGSGGGIWIYEGSATITNSSIYDNQVGGPGYGATGGEGQGDYGNGRGGDGGDAGSGAGVANLAGVTTIHDTRLQRNTGVYANMAGGQPGPGGNNGRGMQGGGIYNYASYQSINLTVERCTLYANEAFVGGGIANANAKMLVRNSTLTDNTASYGGAVYDYPFNRGNDSTVTFCTMWRNTGSAYGSYYVEGSYDGPAIDNTIIAGSDGAQFSGPSDSLGSHNLFQHDNPGLGALSDNGGSTPTMALLDGSAAINAGDPAVPTNNPDPSTDQRGKTRVSGGRADIGAYEKTQPSRLAGVGFDTNSVTEGRPTWVHGQITGARFKDVTLKVTWGDGTSDTYHYSPTIDPFSFNEGHSFPNNPSGTPTFNRHAEVTLSDDGVGTTDSVETVISVVNVAPTDVAVSLDSSTIREGDTATLRGSITDSVATEAFTVQVSWGDGSATDNLSLMAGVSTFTATHRYLDNSSPSGFTITTRVTDDDGAAGPVRTTTIIVTNVAPTLSNLRVIPDPVNEGSVATLTGTISDPSPKDNFTLQITWGDGTTTSQSLAAGTTSFSATHTYLDDDPTGTPQDPYTIGVTATDKDGGSQTTSTGVTVRNVAPTFSGLNATPCLEGGTTTLTGSISDSSPRDTFTLKVEWGDGVTNTYAYGAGTTSFSVTHQVLDLVPGGGPTSDNVIQVTITDDDTGTSTARTTVRVTNVAPTLSAVAFYGGSPSVNEFREEDQVHLAGNISDPGGAKDSYTLKVDWGDGTTSTYSLATGATSFDVTHRYLDDPPGADDRYTATVTLTDADGGTVTATAVVIVYNVAPQPYADTYDADEDVVLQVPAPGVLANDSDAPEDTLHVVVALSDTVSNLGAKVTLKADGSFTYDPTARNCRLQNLAEGESVDDTFTYFVGDNDMLPGDAGAIGTTVTIHVKGHDESGILYVDATASGANDGSSWANAYRELQDALAGTWGGNAVYVAAGTYTPDVNLTVTPRTHTGDRSASFQVHRGVKLYGGFPPGGSSFAERSPASYQTVLSGDVGTPGDTSDNSYQIVQVVSPDGETPMASPTIVDGFVISGAFSDNGTGGGMLVRNASPIVANCTFTGNRAQYGGGLALVRGGTPKIVNCVFDGNSATSQSTHGRGGAIHSEDASPEISNCLFRSNTALESGGAINVSISMGSAAPRVANCTFTANSAALKGGAISNVTSATLEVSNSILWGDLPGEIHDNGFQNTTIRYSDVQGSGGSGSSWWTDSSVPQNIVDGGGNIDADPKFTFPPADLHLQATLLAMSPAIDAGSNSLVGTDAADLDNNGNRSELAPVDLDRFPRFVDQPDRADTGAGVPPIVDMGAYEVQTNPVLTVTKAGTGTGAVTSTSPSGAIACGGTCMKALPPGTPVILSVSADTGSSFLAWVGACTGTGSCSFTMPSAGAAWVGAVFLRAPLVDLAVTNTDGRTNVAPGASVTYTITVTNAGPSDATGATVTDVFPAGLGGVTWACLPSAGSSCTASGSGAISDTVTILAHGSLTYTAAGTLTPAATEALVNTATVTAPLTSPDGDLSNNTAVDTDTIGPEADLAIAVSNGSSYVTPGSPVTYTILVSNAGPSNVSGAQVTDHFPASLLGVTWSCTPSVGSACTAGPVSGDLADTVSIAAGGTLTYTASGVLSTAFSGTLANTANVAAAAGTNDGNLANNSATDFDTSAPAADLSISLDDGTPVAVPGMTVTYTITARNVAGPSPIPQALVTDNFPSTLTCTWTCAGSGGGSCTAGPVSGSVVDLVGLPVGGSVTYTAICRISADATGSLVNTATIGTASASTDPNPTNDSATDTDLLRQLDFGDAPNASLGPPWNYPVTLAEDGARHGMVSGFHLGASVAAEADGTPSASAAGDADDDGVVFSSPLVTCERANVTVTASAPGFLDAWVDFNVNGSWNDAGEQVFTSQALVGGPNALSFTVPCTATVTGRTFARFRFSSSGGLGPAGIAADGEVEDYAVAILGLDFGDAPDPTYSTSFAHDGARHALSNGLKLGALVDAEPDAVATGDADDDGVSFTSAIVPGSSATVTVTASAAGRLDAWMDFNGSGDWNDGGDQIFASRPLAAGSNALSFVVPSTARPGLTTWARFRLSSAGGLGPTGFAADGEVEDYQVTTTGISDVWVTNNDSVTTAVPGGSVTYTIVAGNSGPTPAASAHVADIFPTSLTCTWTCAHSAGAFCAASGAANLDEYVSLAVGATVTYTAACSIAPTARGTLRNTVTVDAPSLNDPNTGNNTATDEDTLAPRGDLAVTKTDGSLTAVPGQTVTYTITASNGGPSQAAGAVVSDTFPGLSQVTWTCMPSTGSSCSGAGSGALNETVSIAPGGNVTFKGGGMVAPGATGTLANTVAVTAPADMTDSPGSKQASDSDTLTPQADLTVTKTGPSSGLAGHDLTYTIRVKNFGPSNAPSVVLADTLPAGTTFVSERQTSGPAFTLSNTATQVSNTISTLEAGASAEFNLVVHVDAGVAKGTVLTNTATATTAAADPTPTDTNNVASVSTTITTILPPMIAKAFRPTSIPFLGGLSTLTFTVSSPADNIEVLTGVSFNDSLPAGLVVAGTPNLVATCNGPVTAAAGSGIVRLENASIDPGGSCNVSVDVAVDVGSASVGDLPNTVTVSSTNGGPGNRADAPLTLTPVTSFSGATATGSGIATASFTGGGPTCTFSRAAWVGTDVVPEPCPCGHAFPHGLLDFATTGCTRGGTLDLTLTMPQPLPPDTRYWKYGQTPDNPSRHWYELPATIAGANITFSIRDGGLGDDDLTENGKVVDQGGPVTGGAEPQSIPALGWIGILLFSALIGSVSVWLLGTRGTRG